MKQINIVTNEPIFYCSLTFFCMHKNKTIIQYNINNKNWCKDSIIHVHRTNNKEMDNWEIKLSQKFQLIDPVSLTRIDTMFIYNKHDDSADNEECSHSEQYDICHVYTESSQRLLCVIQFDIGEHILSCSIHWWHWKLHYSCSSCLLMYTQCVETWWEN